MTQPSIQLAAISDIGELKTLMESVFGSFAKLEEIFTKWITQDGYNVVVAKVDSKIVGVSTWCLNAHNDFSQYDSFGRQALDFLHSHKLAWIVNLAVYPAYRRKQIGQQLSLAQLEWLKNQNCSALVGSSWVNGTDENSQRLYLKTGFTKLGESKEFLRLQMQNGAICAVCKTSDCSCNSILFGIQTADLFN